MKYYFLALQKYANFKGRATRKEFWYFVLFNILFGHGILFIGNRIIQNEYFMTPYYIYLFGVMVPGLAIGIRRMHDAGKSGWFLLIPIYSFILAVSESEKRNNQWGVYGSNQNIQNQYSSVSQESQGGFWSIAFQYIIAIVSIIIIRVILWLIFK